MTEHHLAARRLVVAAAIVDDLRRPTRLLAARRTAPRDLAGRWELPGGKVESGEEPPDALRRELREELGVEVELGDEVEAPDPDRGWPLGPGSLRVWTATVTAGAPTALQDHDELRWVRLTHDGEDHPAVVLDWVAADVPVVEALLLRVVPSPRRVVVLPERDAAEAAIRALGDLGLTDLELVREHLAGEDDAEDAQWLVVVPPGAPVSTEALARLVEPDDGWVERT